MYFCGNWIKLITNNKIFVHDKFIILKKIFVHDKFIILKKIFKCLTMTGRAYN